MGQIFNLLFGKKKTKIGSLELDASINEIHSAHCEITANPVEGSADIADHVRLNALQLDIQGVISNSPLNFIEIGKTSYGIPIKVNLFNFTDRAVDAYSELLKLRDKRTTFTVVTGLKTYKDMIIENVSANRNATFGNSLQISLVLKQIEIAKTETGFLSSSDLDSTVSNLGQTAVDKGTLRWKDVDGSNPIGDGDLGMPANPAWTYTAQDWIDKLTR